MKILSIETSGNTCGVAVSDKSKLLSVYELDGHNLHDKLLAELVRRSLSDLEMELKDISAISLSAGPGSFTGLRIGAALAKALSFDNVPPLISVPTLDAIALSASEIAKAVNAKIIIPLIASHADRYYFRKYDTDGNHFSDIMHMYIDEIAELETREAFICGPAGSIITDGFKHPDYSRLTVRFIAKLAWIMFERQEFTDSNEFTPLYISDFEPKSSRKKLKGI